MVISPTPLLSWNEDIFIRHIPNALVSVKTNKKISFTTVTWCLVDLLYSSRDFRFLESLLTMLQTYNSCILCLTMVISCSKQPMNVLYHSDASLAWPVPALFGTMSSHDMCERSEAMAISNCSLASFPYN